jgi:hypothetical protein
LVDVSMGAREDNDDWEGVPMEWWREENWRLEGDVVQQKLYYSWTPVPRPNWHKAASITFRGNRDVFITFQDEIAAFPDGPFA